MSKCQLISSLQSVATGIQIPVTPLRTASGMVLPTLRAKHVSQPGWLLVCLGLLLLTGCAGSRKHQADKLPERYHAPMVENAQTLDLTKLAAATISQDLIDAGDVIEVTLSAGLSSEETSVFPTRVQSNGTAILPLVGQVQLRGMDLQEAEALIADLCIKKGLYASPHVTVTMKRAKMHRITVLGAVEKPATYELRAGQSDVLQAIVAAGGLSDDAGTFVQIRHPGFSNQAPGPDRPLIAETPGQAEGLQTTAAESFSASGSVQTAQGKAMRIHLATAALEDPRSLTLEDGGIVMVEKREPRPIHVLGLVRKPNRYEYPVSEDLRMLDAIALAGGSDNPLADKVYIIRADPGGGEPLLVEASISKAKRNSKADLRLAPGDVVSLEQTPQTSIFEALRLIGFGFSGRAF